MSLQIVKNQQLQPIGEKVAVDEILSTTSKNAIANSTVTNNLLHNDNVAPTENGPTASQTLNAGEYILRNNQLYKVTTTIASGSAITEGVNIERDTICEGLGDTGWITHNNYIKYRVKNGMCTISLAESNATFDADGNRAYSPNLPENVRPSITINAPAIAYAPSTFAETQVWLIIYTNGWTRATGGIVNKTVGTLVSTVTYPIG